MGLSRPSLEEGCNKHLNQQNHHGCPKEIEKGGREHQRQTGAGDEVWQILPGLQADSQDTAPGQGQACDLKIGKSFVDFMNENTSLRSMVDTGKGNLQWERDIPPAALSNLENLAKSNFKGNLGQIIHDIYQTAHQMFSD